MSYRPATGSIFKFVGDLYPLPSDQEADHQRQYLQRVAFKAVRDKALSTITMEPYTIHIGANASWLPKVEQRIRNSILPDEYKASVAEEDLTSQHWLGENVARAALNFFEAGADALPGEPHLYASKGGALVAEFGSTAGTLTIVISPDATILFAVKADSPQSPMEVTLQRGSNRLGEELRTIKKIFAGTHGQVESSR
jgi:hypothetical protein